MAKLEVEARPGAGVTQYSLFVDGVAVTTDSRHRGSVSCEGRPARSRRNRRRQCDRHPRDCRGSCLTNDAVLQDI